jgi:hypothetical protein
VSPGYFSELIGDRLVVFCLFFADVFAVKSKGGVQNSVSPVL